MKLMNKMILSAVMIMAVAACAKENVGNGGADSEGVVRFVTSEEITKTHFGTPDGNSCPTLWTGNESVAVALNYLNTAEAFVAASSDGSSASFSAEVEDDASGNYSFSVISPSSAFKDKSAQNKRILLAIPVEQTPAAESCDEAAQIIAACTEPVAAFPSEVALTFRHITAYVLLTIRNLEAGAAVQSVKLTSSVEISDRMYWFPETGIIEPHSTKASKEITLMTSSTENIWVALKPTDLSGTTMKVDVTTDKGVYSRTVMLPSGRNLASGQIAQLGLDFTGITSGAEEEPVEPIAVGDLWREDEKAVGVVFWVSDDGKSAKIVSLDRTATTVAWSTVGGEYLGAGSKADGVANTVTLRASSQKDNMPILSFCSELGTEWYWPACNELKDVYSVKESVEATLNANGGTPFGTDQYWSSTEFESTPKYASHVRFDTGYCGVSGDQINKTGSTKRYGRCMKTVTR